jgi:pimeloyl-ACP methyl ester carboxylesterase
MQRITVDNADINIVEEPGKGRGTAILIHGWSSSHFAMSPLVPTLADKYRCISVDLPGFGESPKLAERVTIPRYAAIIAALIEELSPGEPVTLVGHSMGGMISVTTALTRPELVERMILICPTLSGHLSFMIDLTLFPFVMLERYRLTNALVTALEPFVPLTDRLLRPVLFADRTRITIADYERIKQDVRRRDQGRIRAECFTAMRQHDLRERITQVETPTLIIWGMEDNTVPLRDASIVAEEWPDADLRIIPNAGHWPHFETPHVTATYIKGFVHRPLKLLNLDL